MQVVVDGLLVNYFRSGKGKVIVLLHGWGERADNFKALVAALDNHYDVVAPDLPGFGGSEMPKKAWGLNDYADFVAAFIKRVGVKKIFCLIGHSNGGAIAIRGLASQRLKADRLVLIASAGIKGIYKGRVKAVRYLTKLGKVISSPLPSSTKQRLRHKVYSTVGSDMLVAEHLQATFRNIITDDVQADAAKLSLPTLIIYGDHDQQTPLAYGQKFHGLIKGSGLTVIPNAGHFVYLENPREVVQSIQELLQ